RVGQCSEKDIVPRVVVPHPEEVVPPKIDPVVPKPDSNPIGGPKPAGDKPPTVPGRTKPDETQPGPGKEPTKPCKRSDSSAECSDPGSLGSYDGYRYVGMGRTKTSVSRAGRVDNPVAVAGVDGCTAVFFHGRDFVTGTHADPTAIAANVHAGAQEAAGYGTVFQVTIISPAGVDFAEVAGITQDYFPGIYIARSDYTTQPGARFNTFSATPGTYSVQTVGDHLAG
ncbi:MAG: hypothetical protein M1839_002870, partial [Geoglossum umbratile]